MASIFLLSIAAVVTFAEPGEAGGRPAAGAAPAAKTAAGALTPAALRDLIQRLDAPTFDGRQQAARELQAAGAAAVPFLVDALGDASCEVRLRARVVLSDHGGFEDLAPCLAAAVEKPYGVRARELLREQAVLHIATACEPRHADKLFKLWGDSVEAYRDQVWTRITEAKTAAEVGAVVAPLLGLRSKAVRFGDALTRLDALGLSYESSYDAGTVMVQTLARGLREGRAEYTAFAEQHLQALETFVADLKHRQTPPHKLRQELTERVNMSQGAAKFLVALLDEKSPPSVLLAQRTGLAARDLAPAFCRGLAVLDSAVCDRGVGRVHIADLLAEGLQKWPAAPTDGVVQKLVAATTETIATGDKPKALACLDALEACRELGAHRLDVRQGLGEQLAQRLHGAALEAANLRVYSPVRRLHDRLVTFWDHGIGPDHEAFPRQLLEKHLRGAPDSASDEQILAVERYLRILARLQAASLGADRPGVRRYTVALRDHLSTRHDLIAAGVARLDQLLGKPDAPGSPVDANAVSAALGEWADSASRAGL